jgi:integrase
MPVDRTLKGPDLLHAAAAEVCSWQEGISAARGRQVRWVAGEYGRALTHPDHPLDTDAEAGELFRRPPVDAYLNLAARGVLRVRRSVKAGSGDNSRQTRVEVLALLAKAAGAYADLPPQPDPARKQPVAKRARSLLRTSLEEIAAREDALPGQIRMLAIGATAVDTGARSGELCACRIDDLAPTLEQIRIVRRPQGWDKTEFYVELIALSGLSRAALRRWLVERQVVVERVQGASTALWVALRANHRGDHPVPPGTPLEPRGLFRVWNRAVDQTNEQMVGEPSWTPLPTRMEQLRRGVIPKASPAPRQPDAEQAVILLDDIAECGRVLAQVRRSGEPDSTAELEARLACRKAAQAAWAEGIEHVVQLSALAEAGLTDIEDLTAAGWEPALLAAIDRAIGWGRPSKAKAV